MLSDIDKSALKRTLKNCLSMFQLSVSVEHRVALLALNGQPHRIDRHRYVLYRLHFYEVASVLLSAGAVKRAIKWN